MAGGGGGDGVFTSVLAFGIQSGSWVTWKPCEEVSHRLSTSRALPPGPEVDRAVLPRGVY